MSYTYTVPKRRANRIAFRILGSTFFLIAVLQFFTLLKGLSKHPMITMVFMMVLFVYGGYLIWGSFRKAAFDITYRFDEEGLLVTHRYGVSKYSFAEIDFVTMVLADEAGIFYILNVKTKKDVYVIPFTMKGKYCETIYEFVNARLPKNAGGRDNPAPDSASADKPATNTQATDSPASINPAPDSASADNASTDTPAADAGTQTKQEQTP